MARGKLRLQNIFKRVKGNISRLQRYVIEPRAVCVHVHSAFHFIETKIYTIFL
jgi:hypothetical protein